MRRFYIKSLGAVILAFSVLAFWCEGNPATAQEFLKNYAPPLGETTFIPQEEFEAKTTLYQDVPGNDKALSYKFRLPKDWKKPEDTAMTSYQVSNKILGEIVRFYGPPIIDSRSYFSLQAINLEFNLTAQQWLLQYMLSNGYTIQGIKEHAEGRAEAVYVQVENDVSYVIRAVAQINGKRIVLAQYFLPVDNWENEKQMQAQVMSTFELTHPVNEPVEKMTKYHFLDIAEFQYPASWEFKPAPLKSADRMSFELLSVASQERKNSKSLKTLNGRIQVDIVSYDVAESVEDELSNFKKELSKVDLVVGEKLETRADFKFDKDISPGPVYIYQAYDSKNSMLKYEYWIVPMEAGDFYYFVSLITPSRDDDFFVWVRNSQTYKTILELFQPMDEGLINR